MSSRRRSFWSNDSKLDFDQDSLLIIFNCVLSCCAAAARPGGPDAERRRGPSVALGGLRPHRGSAARPHLRLLLHRQGENRSVSLWCRRALVAFGVLWRILYTDEIWSRICDVTNPRFPCWPSLCRGTVETAAGGFSPRSPRSGRNISSFNQLQVQFGALFSHLFTQ